MAKRNKARKGAASLPKGAVTLATSWDQGATGPANRVGLIIEDAGDLDPTTGKVVNPNNVKRVRRVDMLNVWQSKGEISKAQWNTAIVLRAAWEATEQAPGTDYSRPRVDSSPKPDHAIAIAADRMTILRKAWDRVWPLDRALLEHLLTPTPEGNMRPLTSFRDRQGNRPYIGRGYEDGLQALRDALDRAGAQ